MSFLISQRLVISYCFDNVHSNALLTTHTSRIVLDSSQTAREESITLSQGLRHLHRSVKWACRFYISMRLLRLVSIYKWRNRIVHERSSVAWNVKYSLALPSHNEYKELQSWVPKSYCIRHKEMLMDGLGLDTGEICIWQSLQSTRQQHLLTRGADSRLGAENRLCLLCIDTLRIQTPAGGRALYDGSSYSPPGTKSISPQN